MWIEIRRAKSRMLAEMWKDYFEGEGIPTQILPHPPELGLREFAEYQVIVPEHKLHVAEEILRKL